MKFRIITSTQARQDIDNITDYIRDHFGAPMTALRKYEIIEAAIDSLQEHPYWQHLYEDADYYGQSVYVYNVDHYRIFHVPDEKAQTTRVIRVLHQSQNADRQLS